MTVRPGSVLALMALAFGALDCAVYSDALLGQGGAVDPAGGGGSPAGTAQGGNSGSVTSSAGNVAAAGGGGDIGLGSAGDDSSIAGSGGDAGNPSGGSVALGGMTSSGGAGKDGTAGNGGIGASGGTSGSAGATSGGAGKGGSAGTAGTTGSAGMNNAAGTGGTAGSGGTSGTAGSGGTAGGTVVPMCSDYPLTAHATWSASASSFHVNEPASYLIDNTKTRWTTGVPQAGTEWIQIDFGATVTLRSINLQQGVDANDYPRTYAVIVSDTAKDLTGTVRATGVGSSTVTTTITLATVFSGRYLLIKQLGTSLSWWSVEEVEVSCFDN